MINEPYIKKYDKETGEVLNPIVGTLKTQFDNRRTRRLVKHKNRFHSNRKTFHLTVGREFKYLRRTQDEIKIVTDDKGKIHATIKQIQHYQYNY